MNPNVWKVALAVSLAVNLFVIGIGVGAWGQKHRMDGMRRGPAGNPMMRLSEQLSPDKQQAFRQRMREVAIANQADARVSREARKTLVEVFSAPTFDAAAATQALAAVRQAETAGRTGMEAAMVDFAKGLNADERKALAQNLARPFGPGRGGRGGGRGMRGMGPGGPGVDDQGARGYALPPGGPPQ